MNISDHFRCIWIEILRNSMAWNITFFGLSICYLQIKVLRFTQSLLVDNRLFQVVDRYVQPIKTNGVEIECTLEFVVHRHDELATIVTEFVICFLFLPCFLSFSV